MKGPPPAGFCCEDCYLKSDSSCPLLACAGPAYGVLVADCLASGLTFP